MRLLYCQLCFDVVRLLRQDDDRHCDCGRSWGRVTDKGHVTHGGTGVLLGVNENSLNKAVRDRPLAGNGPKFYAFAMPRQSHGQEKEELKNALPEAVQEGHKGKDPVLAD